VPAATAAVAGAAVTVLRTPSTGDSGSGMLLPPEMAGLTVLLRELIPPALAFAGLVPILLARAAAAKGQAPFDSSVSDAFFVLLVPIAVGGWVHGRGRPGLMEAARESAGAGRGAAGGSPSAAPPRGQRPSAASQRSAGGSSRPGAPARPRQSSPAARNGSARNRSQRGGGHRR
ncbi:MAG: hypothetical protein ACRDYD_00695, partial [Acidimicrobiales bacterium]